MELEKYLQKNPKKHLIFDLDRTLARLEIDWVTFEKLFFEYARGIDEELVKTVIFKPASAIELTNKLVARHGRDVKIKIDDFLRSYELSHYKGYTANPSLISFIQANKDKYTFYLWTGNSRQTIRTFLENERIDSLFAKIVTVEDVLHIKPDPEGFHLIFNPSYSKDEYLMIGDRYADEFAAKAAGIDYFQENYFNK